MSVLPYGSSGSFSWLTAGSSSLVAHAVLGAVILGAVQPWSNSPSDAEPEYRITLQRLDSDTLAGFSVQEDLAGTEMQPEPFEEAEETSLPGGPAEPERPDPSKAEPPSASETPSLTAEPLQHAVQTLQTLSPVAEPVSPVLSSDTVSTGPLVVSSALTQAVTAAPVLQTVAAFSMPSESSQPETLRLESQNAASGVASTAHDLAAQELIALIRAHRGPDCFLALPRKDGVGRVGLELLAAGDAAFSQFTATVLPGASGKYRQTRALLDPRQCPAVTYIRGSRNYPVTRLGLHLEAGKVISGDRIAGELRGTAGKYVSLLLIDNNGVVQDLKRFTSHSGNLIRFDVPVTRNGAARDTVQLLLAIASDRPLQQINEQNGQLAETVFAGLTQSAALAVTTFDVE